MLREIRRPRRGEATGALPLFPMTSRQYLALPECESFTLELLDGIVYLLPHWWINHQQCVADLMAELNRWVNPRLLGEVHLQVIVELSSRWCVVPDLCFVNYERQGQVLETHVVGPVDLIAEVLSPTHVDVDRKLKYAVYAEHGISWYWIIDLAASTLDEYELVSGAYGNRIIVPFDQPFAPRLFPGLTIDLAVLGS